MRQKGFAPILILLIIAGIGLLAYFGVFYKSPAKISPQPTSSTVTIAPTVTQISSPTPKPTLDPTMNWVSFTSSKYKYSLKYPDTLFKYNQATADDLWVSTTNNVLGDENLDLSVGMVGPGFDSLEAYIRSNPMLSNNSIKTSVIIDGNPGYKINYIGMGGANIEYKSYVVGGYVYKNGIVYHLSVASKSKNQIDKYITVYDQILSTFKITQ